MKLYLFIIKKEMKELFFDNDEIIFNILKKLKDLDKNYNYGVKLYKMICLKIDKQLLSNYIIDKVPVTKIKDTYKILSFFENTTLKINYTNIIVKTNTLNPSIFKIFHIYHENIMVCDFLNNNYFWLDEKNH